MHGRRQPPLLRFDHITECEHIAGLGWVAGGTVAGVPVAGVVAAMVLLWMIGIPVALLSVLLWLWWTDKLDDPEQMEQWGFMYTNRKPQWFWLFPVELCLTTLFSAIYLVDSEEEKVLRDRPTHASAAHQGLSFLLPSPPVFHLFRLAASRPPLCSSAPQFFYAVCASYIWLLCHLNVQPYTNASDNRQQVCIASHERLILAGPRLRLPLCVHT